MRRLAVSCESRAISGLARQTLFVLSLLLAHSSQLWTFFGVQLGGFTGDNLVIKVASLSQVVVAPRGLGTTHRVVRYLSATRAQFYAHILNQFNGAVLVFMHAVHTPNNNHNKGNI